MLKALARTSTGSSPRVWGQVHILAEVGEYDGIIPTRVGTSHQYKCYAHNTEDHPHACGDKKLTLIFSYTKAGSSPRVWGQVHILAEVGEYDGIIPTRVGTSHQYKCYAHNTEDHPHACGDKKLTLIFSYTKAGSSPRVWGQAYTSVCYMF